MKFLAVCTLLLASGTLLAQDYPRLELSAGYSYGSVDTQGYGTSNNAQGWSGSIAANLKKWVGVEAEVSSRFQTFDFALGNTALQVNSRYYSFLGGPRFAYRAGKVTPFVHALVGLDRSLDYGATTVDPATNASVTPYVNGIAAVPGGGFDYVVNRHVALRTQADYFFTRQPTFATATASNFRVMAGIVFTFGQREESAFAKNRREQTTVASATVAPAAQPGTGQVGEPIPSVISTLAAQNPTIPVLAPQQVAAQESAATSAVPEPVAAPASNFGSAPANPVLTASVRPPEMQVTAAKAITPANAAIVPVAQTAVARSASNANTVIISQASEQWQAAPKQEESLGEIARRYRAKKLHGSSSSGL